MGLLWDSVSNNIGDQAIGLSIKKFCESKKIKYQVVDPFSYTTSDYSTMIIGGGELIRSLGDPFYDQYRVKGNHILNSVGVYHPSDMDYLYGYSIVSVRSKKDRIELKKLVPALDIEVCPCTTILLKEFFPELENNPPVTQSPIIGVHLNAAELAKMPNLVDLLGKINRKYPIKLIPFTLYQNDQRILASIQNQLPNAELFSSSDPLEIFKEIGKMSLMISSSLHATIYSYANTIPFLAYPIYPKINQFLLERNMNQYIYQTIDQLEKLIDLTLENPLDYSDRLEQDKKRIRFHLDRIEEVIKNGLSKQNAQPVTYPIRRMIHNPAKIHHALTMENLKIMGDLMAERLDAENNNRQLSNELEQARNELEQAREEIIYYALSKSWRIIRPFRKITSFLRRMING